MKMENRQEGDADMVQPWTRGQWAREIIGWFLTIVVFSFLGWLATI
jgi:hypothetical protein